MSSELIERLRAIWRGRQGTYAIRRDAGLAANALEAAASRERELEAEVREWLCEKCNYVYPGPPQKGFHCVTCPRCDGSTGPRGIVEREKLKARVAELERDAKQARDLLRRSRRYVIAHDYTRRGMLTGPPPVGGVLRDLIAAIDAAMAGERDNE